MGKNQQKYFEHFAEAEQVLAYQLIKQEKPKNYFSRVLCIPAYDESFETIKQLFENINHLQSNTTQGAQKHLLIFIINTPLNTDAENNLAQLQIGNVQLAEQRSQNLAHQLMQNYPPLAILAQLSLHNLSETLDMLMIQRIGAQGLPYKQGVGLARKIANDCAARLIYEQYISDDIIFNSDVDVIFPNDYFYQIALLDQTHKHQRAYAAYLFAFQHQLIEHVLDNLACQIYQQSLQQYVEGLTFAKSPFAFQTVGSTLALNAKHYVQVRGFPKKNAGEDFYLLNKLRKIAPIKTLNGTPLVLSARRSHRVPFGTGPAIKNLNAKQQPENEAIFYDPRCFHYLANFIYFWQSAFTYKETLVDIQSALKLANTFSQKSNLICDNKIVSELLERKIQTLNLLQKLQQSKTQTQWQQTFMESFDALQTLKYLHELRDQHFPALSYQEIKQIL